MDGEQTLLGWGKDYSRWLNRKGLEENRIPNTVKILIGEEVVICNGIILAENSHCLKSLIVQNDEVRLDQFIGHVDEFYDCLQLLYGGKVSLSFKNVEIIIIFCAEFQVHAMFDMCKKWLVSKMSPRNMYTIFCYFVLYFDNLDTVEVQANSFINKCFDFTEYIRNNLTAITTEVKKWECKYISRFIEVMLMDSCSISLIIDNDWIKCEEDVVDILDAIAAQYKSSLAQRCSYYDKLLCEKYNARATTLNIIRRMKFFTKSKGTKSRIRELESTLLGHLQDNQEILSMTRTPFLDGKVWESLTETQIMSTCHGNFGLRNFEFAEVAIEWLKRDYRRLLTRKEFNKPTEFESFCTRFRQGWTIKEDDLSRDYCKTLYSSLTTMTTKGDDVICLQSWDTPYRMETHCFKIDTKKVNELKTGKFVELSVEDHNKCDDMLAHFGSYNCRFNRYLSGKGERHKLIFKFRLIDHQPCYEIDIDVENKLFNTKYHSPLHMYITYKENVGRKLHSFVTHSRDEIVEILEDLLKRQVDFSVNCMIKNVDYLSDKKKLAEKEELRNRINRITDNLYYDSDSDYE